MSKPGICRRKVAVLGGTCEIVVETAPLNPKRHRFGQDRHGGTTMDGFPARGLDGPPSPSRDATVVTRLEIRWGGRRVPLSDRQWKHLVDVPTTVSLHSDADEGNIWVQPAEDGRAVLLSLGGSDGAGSFRCWWTILSDRVIGPFTEGPA